MKQNCIEKFSENYIIFTKKTMNVSYVYILRCSDNSYYVGVTSNLEKRIIEHQTKHFSNSYTSSRLPLELVYYEEFTDIKIAIEKEKQLKKWSRAKKEALINRNIKELSKLSKKKFE